MWSMLLFLSVYRSGVSVYNVIHAALSVSLALWSIGLQRDPCSSFCQFSALVYRFTMWFIQLFLSVYRSGASVYNVIHAALSVSLPFWNIGLQCDSCSSFCQFTVLEYRFTMWSMQLFLSVYRSGVSVYNVIHAALSVSLPFWSIGLQCDSCSSFCQFTVPEYLFTMGSMLPFLSVYRSGVSVCNDPYCSFCHFTVLEYQLTMWSMLLFLSAYRSGVSVYIVIHAALSVSLPFWSIGLQCDPCCSFC
jgi:hypothetical protein